MSDLKIDVCAMACMKAELSARVRELEAAVRWVGKKEPHWYASWTVAHPIVREVIEKGGE